MTLDDERWTLRPVSAKGMQFVVADGPWPDGPVEVVPVAEVERLREEHAQLVRLLTALMTTGPRLRDG